MTGVTGTNSAGASFAALAANAAPQTPADVAKSMVQAHSDPRGGINFSALKHDLDGLAIRNPELGAAVSKELQVQLGPNNFARMQNASYSIAAADGKGLNIRDDAPSLRSYYEGTANQSQGKTAAEKAEIRKNDLAHYARLDRLWGDGNPKTFEGDAINAGISDLIASKQSLEGYEASRSAAATAALNQASNDYGPLLLDITQMTLDVIGIFDPTGISDGANALISAGRGDWIGAGLSALAIIPVVGALATAGKLGKWAATVSKAVDAAINNPAARKLLEPALKKLNDALAAIPEAAWKHMPDSMRTTLEGIKGKLDELFGAGAKVFSDAVVKTAERLGIPPEKVQSILDTPKGQRPEPIDYIPAARMTEHAKAFENGGSRFTLQSSLDKYGLGQRDGTTFIMTKSEADQILAKSNGDPRKLEQALGLPEGQLDNAELVRVDFNAEAMKDLDMRMPSGNEAGANELWLPGGLLPTGLNEAIIDGANASSKHYTSKVIN